MLVLQPDGKLCYLVGLYRIQENFLLVSLTCVPKTGQVSSQSREQRHKLSRDQSQRVDVIWMMCSFATSDRPVHASVTNAGMIPMQSRDI
jgi:hypothetical protein